MNFIQKQIRKQLLNWLIIIIKNTTWGQSMRWQRPWCASAVPMRWQSCFMIIRVRSMWQEKTARWSLVYLTVPTERQQAHMLLLMYRLFWNIHVMYIILETWRWEDLPKMVSLSITWTVIRLKKKRPRSNGMQKQQKKADLSISWWKRSMNSQERLQIRLMHLYVMARLISQKLVWTMKRLRAWARCTSWHVVLPLM